MSLTLSTMGMCDVHEVALSDGLSASAGLVVLVRLARRVRLALWHGTDAAAAPRPAA
jgi:hypothetical protein